MKKSLLSLVLLMPHLVMASAENNDQDYSTHYLATVLNLPTIDADLTEQQVMMGDPLTKFITFEEYKKSHALDTIVTHFLTEFMCCDLETPIEKVYEKTLFCGHVAFWTVMNGFVTLDPNEEKVKDFFVQQGVDHMVAMSKVQLPFTEDGFQQLKTLQNALMTTNNVSFADLNESYLVLTNVGLTKKQQQDALFTALQAHFSKDSLYKQYFEDDDFQDLFLSCYDPLSEIMLGYYGLIKVELDDTSDDEESVTRIVVDDEPGDVNFVEAHENLAQLIEAAVNTASDDGTPTAAPTA